MIVLDTDHASVLQYPTGRRRDNLVRRMDLVPDETFAAPVVAVEEQMRGWMSSLAKERKVRRQILAYRELAALFAFYADFPIVPFADAAADRFDALGGVGIGASDRKIAAIALANDALLLTANRQDFEKVPGLRFENWMDG